MTLPVEYIQEAKRELARRDLEVFVARLYPRYRAAKHTRSIVKHLEMLERGEITKLIICLPPRHGKTMHASQYFPAWFAGRNPTDQIIIASYGHDLAVKSSRFARDLFAHPEWPFETKLKGDSAAADRWETTQGGFVLATGVGGAMTGFGAHLLIIDDPFKDRAQANSSTFRNGAWDWYTNVAETRMMEGGRQLVMATRWHEDDLIGRLLSSPTGHEWTVLRLPLYAEENDCLGRIPGELLWPGGNLPIPQNLSPRDFAALYQQRPEPDDGSVFKRAWMERRWRVLPEITKSVLAVDGAWKEGIGNDRSAIAHWGISGTDYVLIDFWSGRVEYPDLKKQIAIMIERANQVHKPSSILIEDAASGIGLIQEMKRTSTLPIIGATPRSSKESRADSASPTFEAMKVILPEGASWLEAWISEHIVFPNGKHDDSVDTTAYAIDKLARGSGWSFGSLKTMK